MSRPLLATKMAALLAALGLCGCQIAIDGPGLPPGPAPADGSTPGPDGSVPPPDAGSADAGVTDAGPTDAGPVMGACSGLAPGLFCGARLGLDPTGRFQCAGGPDAIQVDTCAEGCGDVNGQDACYAASCAGASNGYYCGSDTLGGNPALLYRCKGGIVTTFQGCGGGCLVNPPGHDDACQASPTGAPAHVMAAAGDGFAEVRWTASALPQTGFTLVAAPGGIQVSAPPSASGARVSGLTNGVAYTFTVTADSGPASAPSNPVVPGPSANIVGDVGFHAQERPLTCEEASLRMVLEHAGIFQAEAAVLSAVGVDYRAAQVDAGTLYWGDPYTSFVGDPSGDEGALTGYGTYYPNISRVAAAFGATVVAQGEQLTPTQLYEAVLAGHPAVVWIAGDFRYHPASMSWVAYDGRTMAWHGPIEHAIAVVGVTPGTVLVDNPLSARGWDVVSKRTFETTWATFNQMAVVIQ